MLRIYLLIGLLIVLYMTIRWLLRAPPELIARYLRKIGLAASIIILLMLGVMGKLNGLFALIGVGLALVFRMLPVLLRNAPILQRLWFMFSETKQRGGYQQSNSSANKGPMTVAEAYKILGLEPNASRAEILAAHKRLMNKVHPDKGGSNFLAAQLNIAKDLLINQ